MSRHEVIMPGGAELLHLAERWLEIRPGDRWLGVACGTGELELYLADEHGCAIAGTDLSARMVAVARAKAATRRLEHLASFAVADGSNQPYASGSLDGVLCSGALCAFYDAGLDEFRRLLKPGGTAVILDVIWRRHPVPAEVVQCWAGDDAVVLTLEDNIRRMREHSLRIIEARGFHEPAWWEAYYEDRGSASHWQQERTRYAADRDYLGIGLFILGR